MLSTGNNDTNTSPAVVFSLFVVCWMWKLFRLSQRLFYLLFSSPIPCGVDHRVFFLLLRSFSLMLMWCLLLLFIFKVLRSICLLLFICRAHSIIMFCLRLFSSHFVWRIRYFVYFSVLLHLLCLTHVIHAFIIVPLVTKVNKQNTTKYKWKMKMWSYYYFGYTPILFSWISI